MKEAFSVSVAKDYLQFSAAHFITMRGHQCESLHGHNYRVALVVEGALEPETCWVMDFSVLKDIARPLVKEIDHKVILPGRSEKVVVTSAGERTSVAVFGEDRYVFPTRDCVVVPLENSTAEMLASYLAGAVRTELVTRGVEIARLSVEVEESPGQTATCVITE